MNTNLPIVLQTVIKSSDVKLVSGDKKKDMCFYPFCIAHLKKKVNLGPIANRNEKKTHISCRLLKTTGGTTFMRNKAVGEISL